MAKAPIFLAFGHPKRDPTDFSNQCIVSPRPWTGNHTVTHILHPSLFCWTTLTFQSLFFLFFLVFFFFFFRFYFAYFCVSLHSSPRSARVLQRGKSSFFFSPGILVFFLPKNKDWRVRAIKLRATIVCQYRVGACSRCDIVLSSQSPRKCRYPLFVYPLFLVDVSDIFFSRHRQVTDLDVTVLGFSGPGLPFPWQVLCGDTPRLFSFILVCI